MGLTDEQIEALLKAEVTKVAGGDTKLLPRPLQIGPLRWFDRPMTCASRGCRGPCMIKVEGIPYCSSHALTALNRIVVESQGVDLSVCDCKAGQYSNGNTHTYDCTLYKLTTPTGEEVAVHDSDG